VLTQNAAEWLTKSLLVISLSVVRDGNYVGFLSPFAGVKFITRLSAEWMFMDFRGRVIVSYVCRGNIFPKFELSMAFRTRVIQAEVSWTDGRMVCRA